MGDRANVCVKDGGYAVFLYTHWSGCDLPRILRDALKRGQPRWDDPSYLTRIIFCEMIKGDDLLGETGYGISATVGDGADRVLEVDCDAKKVRRCMVKGDARAERTYDACSWSFADYLKLSDNDLNNVWER